MRENQRVETPSDFSFRVCTKCGTEKHRSAFYADKSKPGGIGSRCKDCVRSEYIPKPRVRLTPEERRAKAAALSRKWVAQNPEKRRQVANAYARRNVDSARVRNADYYVRERARILARNAAYAASHPEMAKNKTARWQAKNPDKLAANVAKRRSRKLQATPSWANEFFIAEAYRLAKLREQVCGGKWNVDHIVPLRSKLVCGLHVEHNLRVIPALDNRRKSNRHWPDMP